MACNCGAVLRDHNDVIEFNCCNDHMVRDGRTPLRVKIRSEKCLSPGISITKLQPGVRNAKYQVSLTITIIIHQIFSLARDWSKRVTWANIPQLKLGNIRVCSQFLKPMDNKHKICSKLTVFLDCLLLGTDNVLGQISEHIFAPNEGYCLLV